MSHVTLLKGLSVVVVGAKRISAGYWPPHSRLGPRWRRWRVRTMSRPAGSITGAARWEPRETGFAEVVMVPDEPVAISRSAELPAVWRSPARRGADSADHATDTGGGDGEGAGRLMIWVPSQVDSSKYLAFGTGFRFTRRVDLRGGGGCGTSSFRGH